MKTLGIKITAPFEEKEGAIYWSLRNFNNIEDIVPKGIFSDLDSDFELKDIFVRSQKNKYCIFRLENEEDFNNLLKNMKEKYGNIFGAVSKDYKIAIVSNRLSDNLSQEEAEIDAINTLDWLQKKLPQSMQEYR